MGLTSLEQQIEKLPIYEVKGEISKAGYPIIIKTIEAQKVLGLLAEYVCIPRKQLELTFRREDRLWKESKRQNKPRFLKFLEDLVLGDEK